MSSMNNDRSASASTTRVAAPLPRPGSTSWTRAENLFYWHGITATGVDRIAAEAGIAPTTLYRLFRSKDDWSGPTSTGTPPGIEAGSNR